jgi:gamma-glutamyl-gamma-aminobutyrate hydrolase PuuD
MKKIPMARRAGLTYRFEEKAKPYRDALELAGLEVVNITPGCPPSLDGLDGLVISGGPDLDPFLYGEERHPESQEPDIGRDALESKLAIAALEADLPLLCICRGMQLFNVVHRGSLLQHIATAATHRSTRQSAHAISVAPGTLLARIIGEGEQEVNSRHHQAVGRLGGGLRISARAPDGIIEAIERPDKRFALAVQWHPEDRVFTDPNDRRLFELFAKAADGR